VEPRDAKRLASEILEPGSVPYLETIQLRHRPTEGNQGRSELDQHAIDERTLPPGLVDQPMLTIVHQADGYALSGATFFIALEPEMAPSDAKET
jgi:hypothetical protein